MILLTGATGTIGTELARLLSEQGHTFRAMVRDEGKAGGLRNLGATIVVADMSRPETLPAAVEGIERAFLLTPLDARQVEWKSAFVEAAKSAGVRHVVLASGIGADADTPTTAGRWHGATQRELERSGMSYTFLQPTFFMQNILMFAPSIAGEGVFYQPLADARVSYIDARDIAAVAAAALTGDGHEGKAYAMTGPEALSCADMAEILSAKIGRMVRYVPVPLEDARASMLGAGMQPEAVGALVELYAVCRQGHAEAVLDTVREVLGRPPRDFAAFVEDHARAFAGG